MNPIPITAAARLEKITLPPGEQVKALCLDVKALLAVGETVERVTADDPAVIPACEGGEHYAFLDMVGPVNGEQKPVRVTVTGTRGSVRNISLLVIGSDPFSKLIPVGGARYITWEGPWDADADYVPMSLVVYDSVTYLALAGSTGLRPDVNEAAWFPLPGSGTAGGGEGGGPASYTTAMRAVIDGDTWELTLGKDEYGGVTTVLNKLTGA